MPRTASLRASDVDREAATERLREAAGEGRLEPEELEERLHAALRARTYGELDVVLADLPAGQRRGAELMQTTLVVAMGLVVTLVVVALVVADAALRATIWIARECLAAKPRRVHPPRAPRLL